VRNWEANTGTPRPQYFPAVIEFLGYNPLPTAKTWAERIVRGHTAQGLSQKSFSKQLQVDPSTLARWERGEREPEGEFAARAKRLLSTCKEAPLRARKVG
jgi:DNA-binding transcriptional regulator YiaG